MIVVNKIKCDLFNENCYIVYDDTSLDAVIIDPGSNFNDIYSFIDRNKLKVQAILLTHGHFDHIMSCRKLQDLGYKIYISKEDSIMCDNTELNSAKANNIDFSIFTPDYLLTNENELSFGIINVKIIKTPGHSMGGLSYIIENNLFSGDTLFYKGYGRTDLYGGNFREILVSIKTLLQYVKNGYNLYSGHDY